MKIDKNLVDESFDGVIGHVFIFDRPLTNQELTAIYEAQSNGWRDVLFRRIKRLMKAVFFK